MTIKRLRHHQRQYAISLPGIKHKQTARIPRQSASDGRRPYPITEPLAAHQTIRGVINERQRDSKSRSEQPTATAIRLTVIFGSVTHRLPPTLFVGGICGDFFVSSPFYGDSGVQLLQRFLIKAGENGLRFVGYLEDSL